MNAKTIASATLAAFVVIFVLSTLWHTLLMSDFYASHGEAVARQEIRMSYIVAGELVLALLMAVVYPIGYKGGPPVVEGLRFGALIGLIWILPWSLIIHGIWNVPLVSVLVDAAWHVVEEGAAGIAIGLVCGRGVQRGTV